jgi:hypothetical protein
MSEPVGTTRPLSEFQGSLFVPQVREFVRVADDMDREQPGGRAPMYGGQNRASEPEDATASAGVTISEGRGRAGERS